MLKKEKGESPILYPMNEAVYGGVDMNKVGFVMLDEYWRIFHAWNLPKSAANEALMANHDGKIDRLNNYEFKFLFETGAIDRKAKGFLAKHLRPTS